MKNQEHTVIWLNPVERESAQGRHKQVYTVIGTGGQLIPTKGMKKQKEPGVGSTYSFPLDVANKRLITGMNERVLNPFQGREIDSLVEEYMLDASWTNEILNRIISHSQIKEQTRLELLAGFPYDYYTDKVEITLFGLPYGKKLSDLPSPSYLQEWYVTLYDRPNKFTTATTRGREVIKWATEHPKVAKDYASLNTAIHDFYISDRAEGNTMKRQKQEALDKGIYQLLKLKNDSTAYRRYQVGVLLTNSDGRSLIAGDVSDHQVSDRLSDYLHDSGAKQIENIGKFTDVVGLLNTVEGVDKFEVQYLLQQALNSNLIIMRDGYYVWLSQSNNPNVYKHPDFNKLVNFVLKEYSMYNEGDDVTNWYSTLLNEVKNKGVWVE